MTAKQLAPQDERKIPPHRHSWRWIDSGYRKCLVCGVEQQKIKNRWTDVAGTRVVVVRQELKPSDPGTR